MIRTLAALGIHTLVLTNAMQPLQRPRSPRSQRKKWRQQRTALLWCSSSAASTSAQQSSTSMAAGTSTAACLPCFMAARQIGTCHSHGVAL